MKRLSVKKIFSTRSNGDFIGRRPQLDRLLRHARGESGPNALVMLSAPAAGSTELLRQVYDQVFIDGGDVIPFYFEVKASDGTSRNMALRFVREFLLQTVAFRRRDIKILDSSPELDEIAELALPSDGYWVDRLIETFSSESRLDDERSFLRHCLSAPLRAAGHGARSFVLIDGLQTALQMPAGERLIDDLREIFMRASIPFVFSGLRRFLFARMPFDSISIDQLSFGEAGKLIESIAASTGAAITEPTRDLIAIQLGGNAGDITSLFTAAAEKSLALDSFELVEKVYTDEIFGGRIGRRYDAVFDRITLDPDLQGRVLRLLAESLNSDDGRIPLAYWRKHTGLSSADLEIILGRMNHEEIVNMESGAVRFEAADTVLGDYIAGRARLELDGEARALVVGETLASNLRRAPALLARRYRQGAAVGLRDLLQAFEGRQISAAMFDYGRFSAELKGADDDRIQKAFADDAKKITLPQIIYTAHTAAFYPKLTELADTERSAIALGFNTGSEKGEIVWLAAEIESKLEATRELTEFWCDRLEMVAAHCDFSNIKIWLVAPEGFSPEALTVLRDRNAYGSSRKQAEMLGKHLNARVPSTLEALADEYQIVVPIGEDSEMIAARAVEDIAKRHGVAAKTINQIKTALVEACINAAEHSLSPDRKIYLKFLVDEEKFVITVANRGVRIADRNPDLAVPDSNRRGWGLKLITGLMDDVKIEETDDGTRITLTKLLNRIPRSAAATP